MMIIESIERPFLDLIKMTFVMLMMFWDTIGEIFRWAYIY